MDKRYKFNDVTKKSDELNGDVVLEPKTIDTNKKKKKRKSLVKKLLVVLPIIYTIYPLDLISDLIPIMGWLDDIGIWYGFYKLVIKKK